MSLEWRQFFESLSPEQVESIFVFVKAVIFGVPQVKLLRDVYKAKRQTDASVFMAFVLLPVASGLTVRATLFFLEYFSTFRAIAIVQAVLFAAKFSDWFKLDNIARDVSLRSKNVWLVYVLNLYVDVIYYITSLPILLVDFMLVFSWEWLRNGSSKLEEPPLQETLFTFSVEMLQFVLLIVDVLVYSMRYFYRLVGKRLYVKVFYVGRIFLTLQCIIPIYTLLRRRFGEYLG